MDFLIYGVIAYLLGSIPTAVWIGKMKYGIDVREHGSKNAGATNTFRVLGKKPGKVVLAIDVIKGFVAAFLPYVCGVGPWVSDELINVQLVASLCAVLGHVFPIFAGFNGGKGVATSLGVIIGTHPPAAGVCIAVFIIVFIISNYVSLGAICASISFPLALIFIFNCQSYWLNAFGILLGALVIFAHRKNIVRLLNGTESKMNLFKK